MRSIWTVSAAVLVVFSSGDLGQHPTAAGEWTAGPQAMQSPGPVEQMLYDAERERLVLTTASSESGRQELWAWDGARWVRIPASGPPARQTSSAAYDSRRRRIVLYGGMGMTNREDRRRDTWEWDGVSWHQMAEGRVGTRDHHALAYHEARGAAVMFGGVTADDTLAKDTWEWDGSEWTRVASVGPGGRVHFPMVYDASRRRTVLFGGTRERGGASNDTWAWDGQVWRKLGEGGPPRRSHHRMAFDSHAGMVVLFGGLRAGDPSDALGDTWILEGEHWRQIETPGPAARSGHSMAYDPVRRRTVLYGGGSFDGRAVTVYRDTWEWDGRRWTQIA